MEIRFKGKKKELHDLLCRFFGCKLKTKDRLFVLEVEGADEPIPKGHMTVRLSKPIKPGFRRRVNLMPDEKLDAASDGSYARIEVVDGDSTASVRPESTAESVKLYINGDGALGEKLIRVLADGHIGEGEATISLDIAFAVQHPDATAFSTTIDEESPDEAIPGA